MFGFKVKSTFIFNLGGYFPFIWTALKVLLFGESLLPNLVGLGLGHLYIFLKDIMVISHHKDYLETLFNNIDKNGLIKPSLLDYKYEVELI